MFTSNNNVIFWETDNNSINIESDDLDTVKALEIEWVSNLLDSLETSRLCDNVGEQVIAEFEFKGDHKKVFYALTGYLGNIVESFTENDRKALVERKKKYLNFLTEHNKINSYIIDGKPISIETTMKLHQATEDELMRKHILHDAKMCKCFHNV